MPPAEERDAARGFPAEDRLDLQQLVALLRLTLGQAFRPGLDLSSGTHSRPRVQLVVSLGFFGLMFAPSVRRAADLESYLVLVFTSALLLVLFLVLPETQAARERNADVLLCRPVSRRTLLVARTCSIGTIASLVSTVFGAFALTGAAFRFGLRVPLALVVLASLALQGWVVAVLWVAFLLSVLRLVRVEKVRKTAQRLFLAFFATVALVSFGLGSTGPVFELGRHPWVSLLPSTWFALLAVPGAPLAPSAWGGVAALVAVAGFAALSSRLAVQQAALLETAFAQPGEAVGHSLTVRLLERTALWAPGRALMPGPVAALAVAIVRSCEREEVSRARTSSMLVMSVLAFGFGLVSGQPMAAAVVASLTLSATLEALESARQSSSAAASWLLHAAPLEGRHAFRALEAAALVRGTLVPMALTTVLALEQLHPVLAVLLSLCGLMGARVALALTLGIAPSRPMSREQQVTQPVVRLALTIGMVIAASIPATVLLLVSASFPAVAAALGAMLLAALVALQYGLYRWAAQRIERSECPS